MMGAGLSNTFLGSPNLITRSVIGSYVGDGVAPQVVLIPFEADFIRVDCYDTGTASVTVWTYRSWPGGNSLLIERSGAPPGTVMSLITDGIIAIGANSFTVGAGVLNTAGITYDFFAIQGET